MKIRVMLDMSDHDISHLKQLARIEDRSVANYVAWELRKVLDADRARTHALVEAEFRRDEKPTPAHTPALAVVPVPVQAPAIDSKKRDMLRYANQRLTATQLKVVQAEAAYAAQSNYLTQTRLQSAREALAQALAVVQGLEGNDHT